MAEKKAEQTTLFSFSKFDLRNIFDFFANSCATKHMSDQRGFFNTLKPVKPGTLSVFSKETFLYHFTFHSHLLTKDFQGIGDTKLDVLGIGNINIAVKVNETTTFKILHDILYEAGLGVNFLFHKVDR
jgi:hypothetical protein